MLISSVPYGKADDEVAGDEGTEEVAGAGSDDGAERDPYVVGELVD